LYDAALHSSSTRRRLITDECARVLGRILLLRDGAASVVSSPILALALPLTTLLPNLLKTDCWGTRPSSPTCHGVVLSALVDRGPALETSAPGAGTPRAWRACHQRPCIRSPSFPVVSHPPSSVVNMVGRARPGAALPVDHHLGAAGGAPVVHLQVLTSTVWIERRLLTLSLNGMADLEALHKFLVQGFGLPLPAGSLACLSLTRRPSPSASPIGYSCYLHQVGRNAASRRFGGRRDHAGPRGGLRGGCASRKRCSFHLAVSELADRDWQSDGDRGAVVVAMTLSRRAVQARCGGCDSARRLELFVLIAPSAAREWPSTPRASFWVQAAPTRDHG